MKTKKHEFLLHHLAVAAYQEHASHSVKYNDVFVLFRGLLTFLVGIGLIGIGRISSTQ